MPLLVDNNKMHLVEAGGESALYRIIIRNEERIVMIHAFITLPHPV